jgi:uncharacterized protein (TIGR02266 family)
MAKVSVETGPEPEPKKGSAADRRRFERTELVVSIEYSTVDDFFSEFTRDINEGGVFIETERPQPVGTTVDLQFHLPGSEDPVKAVGLVVRSGDGTDGSPIGMAVEFDGLSSDARERIDEIVRSMRSRG